MDRSFLPFCKPCFMEAFDVYGRSVWPSTDTCRRRSLCAMEKGRWQKCCVQFSLIFSLQALVGCPKVKVQFQLRDSSGQWRTFLCLCVGSLGLTHNLLCVGHDTRQAEVAVQVWQPQAVRARHQEMLEQQPVNAIAQQRSLQMEVKVCRERIRQFALSRVSWRGIFLRHCLLLLMVWAANSRM